MNITYHSYAKIKKKIEWAGCGIGDAFNHSIDYPNRINAQRTYYAILNKSQKEIARIVDGTKIDIDFKPKTKAQLSPFYDNYPSALSAQASIGLTLYLEYTERAGDNPLFSYIDSFYESPKVSRQNIDTSEYQLVVVTVCQCVWTRLVLEDLSKSIVYSPIEIYRLYSSAQEDLRFESLSEIVQAVVLFGDALPDSDTLLLHPLTKEILHKLTTVSIPYFSELQGKKIRNLMKLGALWVRDICEALVKFMPPPKREKKTADDKQGTQKEADLDVPSFLTSPAAQPSSGSREDQSSLENCRTEGLSLPLRLPWR